MLIIGMTENCNYDPELYGRALPRALSLTNRNGRDYLKASNWRKPFGTYEPTC